MTAVNTVAGPIPLSELGLTLPHEHLANDIRAAVRPPRDADLNWLRDAKTAPEVAWLLREEPYACMDHCVLDDASATTADLRAFADGGGRTIIDLTSPGIGRNPFALRGFAEETGVQIVMGSGWYLERFHPQGVSATGEEQLAAELTAEFSAPGIRPGVIGEIGVSPDFTPSEHKTLRAAARAQRDTGVPLFVHLPGWQRRAHEVLDIVLGDYGVSPEAVVLCHMDPSGEDRDYQRAVADRGVWLEFDMIGMPFTYPGEGTSPPPDRTAQAIVELIHTGHSRQLLLSHDVFLKSMLTTYGGNGFRYVPTLFSRRLIECGVSTGTMDDLLTTNPARLFGAAAKGAQ
ncbi:MAG: phosphotriesterase-related protein [Mycobacterium sp.]|nr:phosphotriesterase-related protein [Mycobacterium sp.]